MTTEPASRPARFPAEYGDPSKGDRTAWEEVEGKLAAASNYWVATNHPDGHPHVRPVDGVWIDGALVFGGSPETRWVRNLQSDPRMTVNLGSEEDAVILEGTAELVDDPDHPLATPSTEASMAKYPQYYPGGKAPPFHPFWMFRPTRAWAWTLTGFPAAATRWDFDD